jgi:Mannosyltransferase (PIG-V)
MNQQNVETAEFWAIPGLNAERRAAVRDVWAAFWTSRAIVWVAGMAGILAFGWFSDTSARLDPLYTTIPFEDDFANLLASPAARFDSAWYLAISEHGYDVTGRAAFFPLFPALTALFAPFFDSSLVAGIAISSVSGLVALYLLHRLVNLDFDSELAKHTVWIVACFPSALVLSAVYTEALFLMLSIGSLYAARLGRWPLAGIIGGLAAASRSGGLLLLIPLLILYFYGPHVGRPARADVLWLLIGVPAGLIAYLAYLGLATGDPLATFSAQEVWHRSFVPLGGIALGVWSALSGFAELVIPGFSRSPSSVANGVSPTVLILRDIALCGFMFAGFWLVYEASRRLPLAYTAYAITGLALPLSVPASGYALMSLPRFMFVLFPLWIALALWAQERDRIRPVLWTLGTMLAICSALFTTWSWAP